MEAAELKRQQTEIHKLIEETALRLGLSNENVEPIYDGVTNIDAYCDENKRPRIMWILKEPWDEIVNGKPSGGGYDITKVQKEDPNFINNISNAQKRIIYSMECIRTHGKNYDDMGCYWDMPQHLTDIAYINLSKMPGVSTSRDMTEKFNQWKEVVDLQVKVYDPDVIIMGNTFYCIKQLDRFKDVILINDDFDGMLDVYKTKDGEKLLINAYHPSARLNRVKIDAYLHSLADAIDKYFGSL